MISKMLSQKILLTAAIGFLAFSAPVFAADGDGVLTVNPSGNSSGPDEKAVVSDSICDPVIYTRMKEKANLEARRENYVNQSLVLKPDSLMAITCYDKQLGQTMATGCVSEDPDNPNNTDACKNRIKATSGTLLSSFVGPLKDGKPILTGSKNSKDTVTSESYNNPPTESSAFDCSEMQKLWQRAQCGNFAAEDLPSLKEAAGDGADARKFPGGACTGTKDNTTAGNSQFTFTGSTARLLAPGATTNMQATDLKRCQTAALADLATYNCPETTAGNRCAAGTPQTGYFTNVDGTKYPAITCGNSGCNPKVVGGSLVCAP